MRVAIGFVRERCEQFLIVARILARPSAGSIRGLAGKPRRVHARRAAQCVDANAGIVGQRRQPGSARSHGVPWRARFR